MRGWVSITSWITGRSAAHPSPGLSPLRGERDCRVRKPRVSVKGTNFQTNKKRADFRRRAFIISLLTYVLRRVRSDGDFHPAVGRPAGVGVVGGDRLAFAHTGHIQTVAHHSACNQLTSSGAGTAL